MNRKQSLVFGILFILLEPRLKADSEGDQLARFCKLTIPEFKLNDTSFYDSLQLIEREWTRHYPNDSFPVAVLEPMAIGGIHETDAVCTCDLKQVSALEAIRYLLKQNAMEFHFKPNFVVLGELQDRGGDSLPTKRISITEKAVSGLHLRQGEPRNGNRYGLKSLFEGYGLTFYPGANAALLPDNTVVIRNTWTEIRKAKNLLMLMDGGCAVSRPSNEDSAGGK